MPLPDESTLRLLVTRYASFFARQREFLAGVTLVEPTTDFFPEGLVRDGDSLAAAVSRMKGYAPLPDDLLLLVHVDDTPGDGGGCSSAACEKGGLEEGFARILATDEGYLIRLQLSEVQSPPLLGSALAQGMGSVIASQAGEEDDPFQAEVIATACGLGLLLLIGSVVYAKSCGGVRAVRGTSHDPYELGVLLALFCAQHGVKARSVSRYLETTQAEAFADAMNWISGHTELLSKLRDAPELLETGLFELFPKRGLFSRLFAPAPEGAR